MSFILDALKKSEAERQRKGAPGIADVPQGSGRSGGSPWLWIVGALLAVNLAVLAGLLLRNEPERPKPPAAKTTTESRSAPAAGQFSDIVAEAKRSQPEVAPIEIRQETPPPAAKPVTNPVANSAGSARVVDGPTTFNEMRANGLLQLPDLHLDIHVFSGTPAERFVFINMSRYRENATLDEGPKVQEITPEGVILEHQGMRFLLPRE